VQPGPPAGPVRAGALAIAHLAAGTQRVVAAKEEVVQEVPCLGLAEGASALDRLQWLFCRIRCSCSWVI